jgi:hypothetical protein
MASSVPVNVPVNIAGQEFKCSQLAFVDFADANAIYVVICVAPGGSWTVLDVGEGAELSVRRDKWSPACPNQNVWVCVYSTNDPGSRGQLKDHIKKQYLPSNGKQP